jgi:hypothetical protein
VDKAARLLATVLGQDLAEDADGGFRIARKVVPGRVISTVDPQTRHGHKTRARGFDGYKGHIAIDPDTEIITATEVTPGNSGDAEVAENLLADILPSEAEAGARFMVVPLMGPGNCWSGWMTLRSTMDSRSSRRRR